MAARVSSLASRINRAWVPNIALVASVLLTLLATYFVASEADAKDRLRLANAEQWIDDSIVRRLEVYGTILRGGRGLFVASDHVAPDAFRAFVASLDLAANYPGIQGVGFAARVDDPAFARIVDDLREAGIDDFRVWPNADEGWSPYTAIVFLEPLDARNRATIGFDMYSGPIRRAAMERARDSGMTSATRKLTLKQEIDEVQQPGFLLYTPVYRLGAPTETVEERRAALLGYVYIPFRANDFFGGIFGKERLPPVDFTIYDGSAGEEDALLYDSRVVRGSDAGERPRFSSTSAVIVAGRTWQIICTTRPEFELASGRSFVAYTLITGLVMSMLLFLISSAQVKARTSAERTAADLTRSEEALRVSESRLRRLAESNIIGIVFMDFDGKVREANDAFLEITGFTRDDLVAGRLDMRRIASEGPRGFDPAMLEELKRTGVKEPLETVYSRKDGASVPVLEGLAYLDGETDMAVGFVIDVSERRRVEQERALALERERNAREMAEEANRLKDEFLATVSHELRTPLNAILGWSRLLRTHQLGGEKTLRALETIERNARVQAQLVEDLLDVSRIITGKLRLRVVPVALAPVIEGALEAIRPAAAAKRIELEVDLDASTGVVTGDATRLQQVAWNLLTNAVKFTPGGGRIVVRLEAVDTYAVLVVSDSGPGIATGFAPHVFDRFRQADSSITRAHGGLGLGLAIVRSIVEMHGGSVAVESPGEAGGATFVVRLPLTGIHLDEEEAAPVVDPPPAALAGARAVVVDDDPDSRDVVAAVLEEHGVEVLKCANVAQAAEAVASWHPDVLISDIAMPGGDGYELIRRIRALATEAASTPAIALSAYARSGDRRKALAAGFQEHLAKPFEPARLVAVVTRLARGRQVGDR